MKEMKDAIVEYADTWRMQNSPNRQAVLDEAEGLAKFLGRYAYSLNREGFEKEMAALEKANDELAQKVADLEAAANKGKRNVDRG